MKRDFIHTLALFLTLLTYYGIGWVCVLFGALFIKWAFGAILLPKHITAIAGILWLVRFYITGLPHERNKDNND